MRADRLADVVGAPGFAAWSSAACYLLGAMSEDGLRDAVEAPARQAGLLIEPGLVDLLVREVEGEPGALPLLSHALLETWKRREGNTLTVAGYRATGGIRGAVAQSAEQRLRQHRRRPARRCCATCCCAWSPPGTEGEPVRAGCPAGWSPPTPRTSS